MEPNLGAITYERKAAPAGRIRFRSPPASIFGRSALHGSDWLAGTDTQEGRRDAYMRRRSWARSGRRVLPTPSCGGPGPPAKSSEWPAGSIPGTTGNLIPIAPIRKGSQRRSRRRPAHTGCPTKPARPGNTAINAGYIPPWSMILAITQVRINEKYDQTRQSSPGQPVR